MSYIALARKWRPRTFSTLLGQSHVTRALTEALNQDRVHHAYLFTGTRGVGKTSVARIMAKALNCEQGVSAEPCLRCEACVAIEQGRFIDLIEIDAASKTKVEDTRELLDNVQYAPSIGRYKIYLIDEVHMLSQHSFNALLKTLEEPPAHVKFLLATTDPQKLPMTILSRCLQFHLKPVPDALIIQHVQQILEIEQKTFEPDALSYIAKAAQGSLRDALSILDQAIAGVVGTALSAKEVAALLGYTVSNFAKQLLQALLAHQPQSLIQISRHIATEGGNFRYVLDELLSYLHRMAVYQALPEPSSLIEPEPSIAEFCQQVSPEDTQLWYQIALKGAEDLMIAPTAAIGFEMTLLRMHTFRPATAEPMPTLASQQEMPAIPQPAPLVAKPEALPWHKLVSELKLSGLALSAIQQTEFVEKNEHELVLKIEKAHQSLFNDNVVAKITQAVRDHYQEPIRITLHTADQPLNSPATQKKQADAQRLRAQTATLEADPVFQTLQQEFAADLILDSITDKT